MLTATQVILKHKKIFFKYCFTNAKQKFIRRVGKLFFIKFKFKYQGWRQREAEKQKLIQIYYSTEGGQIHVVKKYMELGTSEDHPRSRRTRTAWSKKMIKAVQKG